MKRGDIYFADLDPTIGSEIQKKRPVLIVSNDANNRMSNTITVVPITSNTDKVYAFEVLLTPKDTHLQKQSKAQCHQVRTISKFRIRGKQIGHANSPVMSMIDNALRIHLAL
jgi:mRNA interferase MazF